MRYSNDGSQYDRGYYGGHNDSEAARRGKADREAQAESDRRMVASAHEMVASVTSHSSPPPSAPATFLGTVKACSLLGLLLSVGFAYLVLHASTFVLLAFWGLKGLAVGAIVGVALYAAIVILREILAILAIALQFAFWVAIVVGVLYFLSR